MSTEKCRGVLGYKKLTRFEIAAIVGARALQLTLGAPPLVDVSLAPSLDPVAVALVELREGVLPITVRRMRPDGERCDIALSELLPGSREDIERLIESWRPW